MNETQAAQRGKTAIPGKKPRSRREFRAGRRLPSPSRHIYKRLTIAIAFRRSLAFDPGWQDLIKVDGTFA
jgi:hypothetical protein